jgi:hypothetical protein
MRKLLDQPLLLSAIAHPPVLSDSHQPWLKSSENPDFQ